MVSGKGAVGAHQSSHLSVGCLRGGSSLCCFPPPVQDVLQGEEDTLKDVAKEKGTLGHMQACVDQIPIF